MGRPGSPWNWSTAQACGRGYSLAKAARGSTALKTVRCSGPSSILNPSPIPDHWPRLAPRASASPRMSWFASPFPSAKALPSCMDAAWCTGISNPRIFSSARTEPRSWWTLAWCFPLAAWRGNSRSADAGSGTFAYMAPEQRRERFVDARADLFSARLHPVRVPDGDVAVWAGGARTRLRWSRNGLRCSSPGTPDALDSLIMRLLTRSPHDRIGYATDVVALLQSLSGQDLRPCAETRTTYLYRSQFVGRRKPCHQLSRTLEAATGGRGAKAS